MAGWGGRARVVFGRVFTLGERRESGLLLSAEAGGAAVHLPESSPSPLLAPVPSRTPSHYSTNGGQMTEKISQRK